MTILSDTNIVLALVQSEHDYHRLAWKAVKSLWLEKETVVIVPQVLYEFWTVATRPRQYNGVGWDVERASQELNRICAFFNCMPDGSPITDIWRRLVISHRITGKRAHDVRLVAAMEFHGIDRLLTFNVKDFTSFPDIEILDPALI